MGAGLIGLTYIDRLSLHWSQWAVLILFSVYPVWWGRWVVLAAFWGQTVGTDSRLLFQECQYLRGCTWSQFQSEYTLRQYVDLQNPFVIFAFSRVPVFWAWQAVCVAMGDRVTPTPLSLLMLTQPSPDVISFLLTLSSYRAAASNNMIAAVSFGAGCITKSSALVLLPCMAYRLRGWIVIPLGLLAAYWAWMSNTHAGRKQLRFLSHLVYARHRNGRVYRQHTAGRFRAVKRRWAHYRLTDVLLSLPVYLFPAYLSYSWRQWAVFGLLTLLAPNVKYYLLSII